MKLAMNISNSEDSHECIHHSRISPVITTDVASLRDERGQFVGHRTANKKITPTLHDTPQLGSRHELNRGNWESHQ